MSLNPKHLVGKTIARVEMNTQRVLDNGGPQARTMHFPTIYFTDGSALSFLTEEHPDGAEYGTDLLYSKPPRRFARRCACGLAWKDAVHKRTSPEYEHDPRIEVTP